MQSRLKSYFSLRGLCRWKSWILTQYILYLQLKLHSKILIISFGCDHKFICLSKIIRFQKGFLIMGYLSNFSQTYIQFSKISCDIFKNILWYPRISNSEDVWQPGSMVLDNELFVLRGPIPPGRNLHLDRWIQRGRSRMEYIINYSTILYLYSR